MNAPSPGARGAPASPASGRGDYDAHHLSHLAGSTTGRGDHDAHHLSRVAGEVGWPRSGKPSEGAAEAQRIETSWDTGRMVWHAWGSGPPLVLFHGGSGSWRHWMRNIDFFVARGRRVVCADLPGLGESDMPPEPENPTAIAALLARGVASVLDGARYDLAGFSFGGVIAGVLAAQDGACVRSLTIVGSGGLGVVRGRTELVKVRHLEGTERREAHRINLARLMIADPARIDERALLIQDWNTRHSRIKSPPISRGTWLIEALRDMRCPVNGIWGSLDAPSLPDIWARERAMRAAQPALRFVAIEGAGHWVAYEAADAFNAALARLLDN